jgi:hypothetical protein
MAGTSFLLEKLSPIVVVVLFFHAHILPRIVLLTRKLCIFCPLLRTLWFGRLGTKFGDPPGV